MARKQFLSHSYAVLGDAEVFVDSNLIVNGERELSVEPRAMSVLSYLIEHQQTVVSADELLEACWPNAFLGDNPVHKTIAQLRRVLGDTPKDPKYIQTVRGRGYILIAPCRASESPPVQAHRREDSPFPGLRAYSEAEADVFFGRGKATAQVLDALCQIQQTGGGHLELIGDSGVGKSSLIFGSLVPHVRLHGLGGQAHQVLVYPNPAQFFQLWRAESELTTATFLVIDEIEQLHIEADWHADKLELFFAQLSAITSESNVVLLLAVRSDHFVRYTGLASEFGFRMAPATYSLKLPEESEIGEIVRRSAMVAGLRYEDHPQHSRLDDVIRDEAVVHPSALPLLQQLLTELYAKRTADGLLTHQAYEKIGGLAGSISNHAEKMFLSASQPAQDSLAGLLKKLCFVDERSEVPQSQPLDLSTLTTSERSLVDHFARARLFVFTSEGGNITRCRLSHDSVLSQWPRAMTILAGIQDELRLRTRMSRAASLWAAEGGRKDLLARHGPDIEEMASWEVHTLTGEVLRFRQASRLQHQRNRWIRAGVYVAFGILLSASLAAALLANQAQNQAKAQLAETRSMSEFLLTDLLDELRKVGKSQVLASVAQKVEQRLLKVPESLRATGITLQLAKAQAASGQVLYDQGNLLDAEQALLGAQSVLARLPESEETLWQRSQVLFWRGAIALESQQLDTAGRLFAEYADATEQLISLAPDSHIYQLEQSYALNNLGTLAFEQGQYEVALERFEQSIAIKQDVADEAPTTQLALDIADSTSWLGNLYFSQGAIAQAVIASERELSVLAAVYRAEPDNAQVLYRRSLALARNFLWHFVSGDLARACASGDEAGAISAALVDLDPHNQTWQADHLYNQVNDLRCAMWLGESVSQPAAMLHQRIEGLSPFARESNLWAALGLVQVQDHLGRSEYGEASRVACAVLANLPEEATGADNARVRELMLVAELLRVKPVAGLRCKDLTIPPQPPAARHPDEVWNALLLGLLSGGQDDDVGNLTNQLTQMDFRAHDLALYLKSFRGG